MSPNGYPLPVKSLRSLALTIARQRSSAFQVPSIDDAVRPPGKNWPQSFYARHPELKARRVRALDWTRHDHNIHDKVTQWFSMIGRELQDPLIVADNVYNMDETGVLLSVLHSLKVLVSRDESRNSRGAGVKRTLVTAIECISAAGRHLPPLIIWPASTHRSTWTTHPTPGWHFACSKSGYTDKEISLYWIQHVFDPLTRPQAQGKPRILINDGFATHESLELLKFCLENNIVLCRLPSHTSHKLQPCDVGVFGPLKAAYREQVEQLYRGGANTVGKQHFTLLYSRARDAAFMCRNIKSGWSKAGLFPFNPNVVLRDIQKPPFELNTDPIIDPQLIQRSNDLLTTPVTSESLTLLRRTIEQENCLVDDNNRHHLQKLANAAEKAFADRAVLLDENRLLFKQNNEKTTRQSVKGTVVGSAKVMSYDDTLKAQQKRDAQEADTSKQPRRGRKRRNSALIGNQDKRPRVEEAEKANREIEASGLTEYCSILQF